MRACVLTWHCLHTVRLLMGELLYAYVFLCANECVLLHNLYSFLMHFHFRSQYGQTHSCSPFLSLSTTQLHRHIVTTFSFCFSCSNAFSYACICGCISVLFVFVCFVDLNLANEMRATERCVEHTNE